MPEIHRDLARARRGDRRAHRHQPARPLRGAAWRTSLTDAAPAAAPAGRARAGDPGARRAAAGRRARGAVGDPRLPVGRGPAGPQPALRHRGGPGACCCARSQRALPACRSRAWSPTASTRSARRWRAALPGVPHQLCQFHYLREAAQPIYEADRHAKKELKKKVRGVRPIERAVEGRTTRGRGGARLLSGGAQRAHRRRPAAAGGLGPEAQRPAEAIAASLDRVAEKGGSRRADAAAPAARATGSPHTRRCGRRSERPSAGSTRRRRSWTT